MNRSSFHHLLYLAAVLSIFFFNCKKSSSGPGNGSGSGYYMRCKLNGASVEYNSQAFAGISHLTSDNLYTCVMGAYKDVNAGAKNAFTITIFSANPIAAGVGYNDPLKAQGGSGNTIPQTTIFWYDATGAGYLTAGALSDNTGSTPISGVVANAQLTITELTSTYLKGTFSGTAYRSDFASSEAITDGEFYLRRSQ
jgi:hypothetical protein